MRGVTLCMSPSSREERNAEKCRNHERHRDTENKRVRKEKSEGKCRESIKSRRGERDFMCVGYTSQTALLFLLAQ